MSDQQPPSSDFQLSLGEVLKNRRIALGRSIEQLSALTRIHAKTLKALEENQYSELPARAFTRGFIISYAKALGLSGEELVKIYHDFLEEKFAERPNREKGHEGYTFESKEKEQNKRWLITLGSVAAVFAVVVLLFFKPQNHKRKEKHKEFAEESPVAATTTPSDIDAGAIGLPVINSPNSRTSTMPSVAASAIPKASPTPTIATVKPSPTATPETSPSTSPTPVTDPLNKGDDLKPNEFKKKVSFESIGDVWVRYQSDDKKPMALMLRKGKFLVIKAKQRIHFDTKIPENLKIRLKSSSEFKPLELKSIQIGDDGAPSFLEDGVSSAPAIP